MHHLIASYLFQNKNCPLPGLGNLSLTGGEANADFTNKVINAPIASINFVPGETNATGLLSFVATSTNSSTYEATEALDHFCDNLKNNITVDSPARLEGVGDFFVNNNGDINFEPVQLPAEFLQQVKAERVIHPQAEHSILVGDKETTNTLMTEFFNEDAVVKDRWWIWAIVLGLIGLTILLIYFNDADGSAQFGNAIKL